MLQIASVKDLLAEYLAKQSTGTTSRNRRAASLAVDEEDAHLNDYMAFESPPPSPPLVDDDLPPDGAAVPESDSEIRRIFHPHSERETIYQSHYDFRKSQFPPKRRDPTTQKPWEPFSTRLNFEFADFVQDTMLNKRQTEALISLIRACAENINSFTIRTHGDLTREWALPSKSVTEFVRSDIIKEFRDTSYTFEMHVKPLWSWTLDIVQDPHLADYFVWDPERDFVKNTASKYVRFFTEPWTANSNLIPPSPQKKVLPYILYADKSKLSSFGTQKGYPIIARLGNVVTSLHNRFGGEVERSWAGCQCCTSVDMASHFRCTSIWILPQLMPAVSTVIPEYSKQSQVEEDSEFRGQPDFVNFKNAVWHESFYKLLESIVSPSKTGDCVMALIRGLNANYPCPICYVKREDQLDYSVAAELRTGQGSQDVYDRAQEMRTKGESEALLKDHGLRNVKNVFWNVAYSDPHRALGFDKLHFYSIGLWGDHLFEQAKKNTSILGGVPITQKFDLLPRWRDLNHFDSVTMVSFNDGTKHDDIARMWILASHNVLTSNEDTLLLRCIRTYQELYMYASKDMHTSETLAEGETKLQEFGDNLQEYIAAVAGTDLEKGWIFPKIHLHRHAFRNIKEKGVTKNFGTHYNESMHRSTREIYHRGTNFKDVAAQFSYLLSYFPILKFEHRKTVCERVRAQLDDLDELRLKDWSNDDEDEDNQSPENSDIEAAGNFTLGSAIQLVTFETLEQTQKHDPAFARFRLQLSDFLNTFLPAYNHTLPQGRRVNLQKSDMRKITPYRFLKIFYQSMDDWSDKTDYLRCNPNFHGRARYDCALVKTDGGEIFVRLLYLFRLTIGEFTYPLVFVQPMDAPRGRITGREKDLKLFRIRAKAAYEFIPVQAIIRGVVLAPAFDKKNEYMVADLLDQDIFFRLQDRLHNMLA
ncbi:hypothetical protein C8F01DRAFT_1237970 [Mycena amicta]|nr:hypothetical protein C8F01DRAFT_1237970 [Mycena amicta]